MKDRYDHELARKAILRRATLYTLGFVAAGLFVALVGTALIAWLLVHAGMPFFRTWLILVLIVVLPGLIAAVWRSVRGR